MNVAERMKPEPEEIKSEAEYMLESPASCPSCKAEFDTVKVVRLLRTRTNFTSTLPRRGYLFVCPACHGVMSAGLGSLMAIA